MDATFKIWETCRKHYLSLIEQYSLEQLNKVPDGFSNNIVWNLGHIIVAQQGLVYRLSGLPMNISDEMRATYMNGTKPLGTTTQEEIDELKSLLISLVEQTKDDYSSGKFVTYNEYTTGTGYNLKSLEEAMEFNNLHEGIHFGIIMSIKKFI